MTRANTKTKDTYWQLQEAKSSLSQVVDGGLAGDAGLLKSIARIAAHAFINRKGPDESASPGGLRQAYGRRNG